MSGLVLRLMLREAVCTYNVEGSPIFSKEVVMFERYTEKARRVIFFARYEASQFGCPYIETEHLLLGILREDKALSRRLLPGMSHESIRSKVESLTTKGEKVSTSVDLPLSNECKCVLAYAAEEAERLGHKHIGTEHLLLGLLREEKSLAAQLLGESGLRLESARETIKKSDPVASGERVDSTLGSSIVSLTQRAQDGDLRPFVDREKEMESLFLVLGRSSKNNAVLVGEPGVGKRSIAEGLAQRMATGGVPAFLSEKSLFEVDIARLAARRGSNEGFLKQLAQSLPQATKSVLLMEDLAGILAAGHSVLVTDVIEIVKPLLLGGSIQCVAIATPELWEKALTNYSWLDRCFRRIDVEPMSQAATMEVLLSAKERYEKFHVVVYTADALQYAVLYSSIHIKDRHLPDKALDLLDEAAAYVNTRWRLPEEVVELRKRIRFIIERMQNSIANHEFEKARFYSDEERKERAQLQELLKKHNLTEGSAIGVTRSDIEEVLSRWTGIPVSKIRESGTSAANTAEQ
jgi:ATP-dependent Clp protease ATP-binding subunit ClpC